MEVFNSSKEKVKHVDQNYVYIILIPYEYNEEDWKRLVQLAEISRLGKMEKEEK